MTFPEAIQLIIDHYHTQADREHLVYRLRKGSWEAGKYAELNTEHISEGPFIVCYDQGPHQYPLVRGDFAPCWHDMLDTDWSVTFHSTRAKFDTSEIRLLTREMIDNRPMAPKDPTTLKGRFGATYSVELQHIRVKKKDGKTWFLPIDDVVMVVAAMKRKAILDVTDKKLLGFPED